MKQRTMDQLATTAVPVSGSKAENEDKAVRGVQSGNGRRGKGRTQQVSFRCTVERRAQLARLTERLSAGRAEDERATAVETFNRALDALERELRG